MRILYLTDRLTHRGGAPHHLLDVIEAMAAEHHVTIAAGAKDQAVCLPEGVAFKRINGLRSNADNAKSVHGLNDLLKWADLTHIQNVMNPLALAMATEHNCIVTVQDHRVFCPGPGKTLPGGDPCHDTMSEDLCSGCLPEASHRAHMLSLTQARLDAIKNARRILVLSDYMRKALEQVGLKRIDVLPPPVKPGPKKASPGHGFLLAGRVVKHKAPEVAYAAWKTSGTPQPLRIAGLGPETNTLQEAEQLGWLDRDELRTVMAESRALLFPSRWQEPFGIVGAEALAMGTPVIVHPTGGMMDWCRQGCLLVRSEHQMVSAIQYLDSNPAAALALGREGSIHINHHFSPQIVAKKLQTIYSESILK